jgi:hypothetical protein
MATPLWLSDNVFDEIGATPDALLDTLGATDDAPGHEVWRVADGLRDRTWWTVTTPNATRHVRARLTAARAADTLVLDRGHNLAGKTIEYLGFSSAGVFEAIYLSATIPTTPGGLPSDATGCLLPTGEWWKTMTGTAAHAQHVVRIPAMGAGLVPLITGLTLGKAFRWPTHWNAPSAYDDRRRVSWVTNRESEAGVRVKRGRRVHRHLDFRCELDAEQWTPALVAEFARVVDRGLPVWHCTDEATAASAAALGLFQVAGDVDFDPVQAPVHREVQLALDEVAPVRQR